MDAKKVVEQVIDGRKRFGKMYGLGEFSASQILDALVVLHEEGLLKIEEDKDELTKVKRQLTASKAREAKQKKKIEKLEKEVWHVTEQNGVLQKKLDDWEAGRVERD